VDDGCGHGGGNDVHERGPGVRGEAGPGPGLHLREGHHHLRDDRADLDRNRAGSAAGHGLLFLHRGTGAHVPGLPARHLRGNDHNLQSEEQHRHKHRVPCVPNGHASGRFQRLPQL
ncbi:MAG: hypothetical protein AVDCRST_MAG55-1739, partial [uncultured Rubrobacteraceae bacterium]